MAADRALPEDFHALYDAGVRNARGTAPPAAQVPVSPGHLRMDAQIGDLEVDYDHTTALPNRITRRAPAAGLTGEVGAAPEETVQRFVTEHGDLWRLSEADAQGVEVVSVSGRGLRTVQLVQRADGLEVFNSEATAAIGPDGDVISVAGQFFPGAAQAAGARAATIAASSTRDTTTGVTTAEEAITVAAFDLTGVEYPATAFSATSTAGAEGAETGGTAGGSYRFYRFTEPDGTELAGAEPAGTEPAGTDPAADGRPAFERDVRVKDVLFPLGEEQFTPGYYLELWIEGFPAFSYVIDALGEPEVLFRKNLRADAAFTYRVFNTGDALFRPEDGPAPGSPHPTGRPDGFQAAAIPDRLVTLESLLPDAPWLPDGAMTTRGNNCIAYADAKAPDGSSSGDVDGRATGQRTFDHAYDHARPASDPTNLQASLVGMFFHVNWLHDRWYEAGFDEAAGNAQQVNLTGAGLGGDPILAEGNDFSGTDNANMQTPADGASPRMQMYEFRGVAPLPSRTSNFDALITYHELGHYITNRLVGNATGLANQQGRAMGEGWGDFFAITMTSQATDDFGTGAFPAGGWTDLTPAFKDNYYFSIRRYPYSADLGKNPLTFKHISNGVVLPAGPPRRPHGGGPNSEVHNAGEVWCAALWEVFVNLVAAHGHVEAERRVLEYVVGGLKLTPSMPTFTLARDGIVTAVAALNPGDLGAVWRGFAKRGLGAGAVSPPSTSTSLAGVVESFSTP
ncbi:M36 family metallopeptidase [Kocuria rosea]|uniref:M36 family metallopeptidase n=1 Tax=Kocuria rosea TaxID=1275 RepID=UPI002541FA51|nr:M36 family metallopeptidase [Kocuria rosea]WIG16384.1 M36 family metallopeptidase [Kocuria rosea]